MQYSGWRILIILVFLLGGTHWAQAQKAGGPVGIGIQFGQPSGLTLKIYRPQMPSVDILAAWDLNDFFFLNVHAIWEQPLASGTDLNWYYGPGAFIGFYERNPRRFDDDKTVLGFSGVLGLNYYIQRFEIYAHINPRIRLIDRTDTTIGGALGFRFYL